MPLKTNLKIIFLPLLLITLAFITSLLAGTITNNATPVPTGYTLTDIYNLIHNNTTATEANHSLSATTSPTATSSYSISQLYADLANLIKRENLETGTTYLGVTGLYDTPDPAYATTTVLPSSLDAQGTAGDSYGYSLDDIYELITNNATTTAHSHPDTPDSTPASSMHTLTEIYTELSTLIDPAKIKSGVSYLGTEGNACLSNADGFFDGDGSPGDPYQICSWTQLNDMRNHLASSYKLNVNLSLADTDYTGIGSNWTPVGTLATNFSGSFDGDNKTISDLTINKTSYTGLFGRMSGGGDISNLGLLDVNITGTGYTGSLVGYKDGGTVSDCYSTGSIVGGGNNLGGLIGGLYNGTTTDSYSSVSITASSTRNFIGGLIGITYQSLITDSYATGDITGGGTYIGGLIGALTQGDYVYRSFATGNISSRLQVGGLVGYQASGEIHDSYAWGNVTASVNFAGGFIGNQNVGLIYTSYSKGTVSSPGSDKGGFIGDIGSGTITDSYWDTDTSGLMTSEGGTGKTTVEMQTESTYVGWDFSTIWNTPSGNYPTLAWE
jgi:hypothetical protein